MTISTGVLPLTPKVSIIFRACVVSQSDFVKSCRLSEWKERFTVLAQERNYTRAAEKLNIPQPHLSAQIKNLEKELGVTLFIRDRPLKLTPAGTVFFTRSRNSSGST